MAEVVQARTSFAPSSPSRKRSASPDAAPSTTDSPSISTALTTTNNETPLSSEPPAKKTKLIRRKRRPARPQVDASTLKSEPPPQTGTIFNIWYNKWSGGDREDAQLSKTAAPSRCNIRNDSGWTAADKTPGSYFCLFFARGICPKGHECQYLHRLPTVYDIFNPNVDCFGRDKHSDYRDDMGGVGSFLRQNRTLYVGRIHVTDDIEEIVARHFQEWGEIERVRVLTGRGVAFVTYVNEANSQFAKEAMAHQALDNNEILNVRWATTDPNPLSQKREAARIEEQAAEAVRRALGARAVKEIEGRETKEEREQRRIESGYGLEGYEAPEEIWFNQQKQLEAQGMGERSLIEAPTPQESNTQDAAMSQSGLHSIEKEAVDGSDGIFSGSTLAALRRNASTPRSLPAQAAKPAASAGPLVAYGSDDETKKRQRQIMTPNIMKSHTDTSKFIGTKPDSASHDPNNNPVQNYNPASDDKKAGTSTGAGAPLLSSQGAIGSAFRADGAVGSVGESVGGPLSSGGIIGQHFTESGSVGGTINNMVGGAKKE
ncbi:Pre-mRNA-splicing factor [Exophiala xenobiotica]|uniref:Pre-mRNA-splicing factor CWC2 n=1 Tax=Vermiconidia calcicola TaxID=1690605 RepID=A0AAV9Q2D0_9PEZI|nr:Pre-mRNA-splicing factor [Exophiala xenobiotica]KAK5533822.1 Pre-mRNA-splicing factor [Vermiconidia calcicola]KAK5546373.1 Pre-mRNA-splicing factor [Chaetothyriales sp. CCFEE 6169]KAK5272285.1 Pre-mRNA-splicing factor [Exophiala xenobiotica]KAK5291759.1 Pre-mRNA-splicing factor [Exophiala xenobiotica]